MMNIVFVLLSKGAFTDVKEGANSKKFSLAPFACSRPPSFHTNDVIDGMEGRYVM